MNKELEDWAKRRSEKKGNKWPREKLRKAKRLAEKMKGNPDIDNPHALARWAAARGRIGK